MNVTCFTIRLLLRSAWRRRCRLAKMHAEICITTTRAARGVAAPMHLA